MEGIEPSYLSRVVKTTYASMMSTISFIVHNPCKDDFKITQLVLANELHSHFEKLLSGMPCTYCVSSSLVSVNLSVRMRMPN